MMTTLQPQPLTAFPLFTSLPTEIRLKIWRLTFPSRVVEALLKNLTHRNGLIWMGEDGSEEAPEDGSPFVTEEDISQEEDTGSNFHLFSTPFPVSRPAPLPVALHINQESRAEALFNYRVCYGNTFTSPYAYPYNLYLPTHDTLYFPLSLYSMQSAQVLPEVMWSGTAAVALGLRREFILDRISRCGTDVEELQSLAISWSDMHVKDVDVVREALRPFKRLRELLLVFFEQRPDRWEVRSIGRKRGRWGLELVGADEVVVRGRFLERVLEEHQVLARELTAGFREMEKVEGDGWKAPVVGVRVAKFLDRDGT